MQFFLLLFLQNSVHLKDSGIFRPGYFGKNLEPYNSSFIAGSSDHFLLAYVKISLQDDVDFVQS